MIACVHHSLVLHAPGSVHHTNCISISNQTWIHATYAFSHIIYRLAEATLVTFCLRCISHLTWTWIMHWLQTCFCFGLEYSVSIYALEYRMRVSVAIIAWLPWGEMLMWYKLLECLWGKVRLFELEQLVEIRALAYLRVANFKLFFQTNRYAMLLSNSGNLVYTCLLCA